MREIKFEYVFKEIDTKHSKIVKKVFTLSNIESGLHLPYNIDNGYELVVRRQYTSLKDKNGKEIYEGDKINSIDGDEFKVRYNSHKAFFYAYCSDEYNPKHFYLFNMEYYHSNLYSNEVEVIGNIYENPELLEQN